jgi:hypothetical protein
MVLWRLGLVCSKKLKKKKFNNKFHLTMAAAAD